MGVYYLLTVGEVMGQGGRLWPSTSWPVLERTRVYTMKCRSATPRGMYCISHWDIAFVSLTRSLLSQSAAQGWFSNFVVLYWLMKQCRQCEAELDCKWAWCSVLPCSTLGVVRESWWFSGGRYIMHYLWWVCNVMLIFFCLRFYINIQVWFFLFILDFSLISKSNFCLPSQILHQFVSPIFLFSVLDFTLISKSVLFFCPRCYINI